MTNSTATELFERGKSYYDNDKYEEARKAFAEAVRLEPNNADYHAWLARALNSMNRYREALAPANRAIELDPQCQLAYRTRGHAYRNNKEFQKAIQDYSQAIQLDPQDYLAFDGRADAYYRLEDYEKFLVDQAQFYRLHPNGIVEEHTTENPKFQVLCETVYKHLTGNLLPRLKASNETFVMYEPCYITWDMKTYMVEGRTHTNFSYGTGYLCLSTENVYLYSLGEMSRKYPAYTLYITGLHPRGLEKTDKSWIVSYQTISGAQTTSDGLRLVTPAMIWEITPYFKDSDVIILAGINLGMSGRYLMKETVQQPSADIIGLLNQLGELKAKGIITEAEFEQKKKELLGRL